MNSTDQSSKPRFLIVDITECLKHLQGEMPDTDKMVMLLSVLDSFINDHYFFPKISNTPLFDQRKLESNKDSVDPISAIHTQKLFSDLYLKMMFKFAEYRLDALCDENNLLCYKVKEITIETGRLVLERLNS
jgi:hypothetical protein